MNIRPSTITVEDDYGLIIEVKPLDTKLSVKDVTEDAKYYFSRYRIISAYVKQNEIDHHKDELAKKDIGRAISHEESPAKPTLAKMLSTDQRIYIVKEHLPENFDMADFIKYITETYNYSEDDAKKMWKLTHAFLSKRKDIQIVNPGSQKTQYKYKYIGTIPDEIREKIKALENGGKVDLSN